MGRLDNKVTIITGGASGIGAKMVELFAKEGAIVIAADINDAAIAAIDNGKNIFGMKLNVMDDANWKELVDNIVEKFGKIDVLVNNAGISSEKPMEAITVDDWSLMHNINAFGPFLGMKHVSAVMKENGNGSIVNISSFTAQIGMGLNAYSASKGSVRAISKAAATAFGKFGVRVNAVFPGIIETPMTAVLKDSAAYVEAMVKATPLSRLGQPADIANAAIFLASDEASFITGSELVIDGGFSAQ
ncbi:SDR family oxidoreductase [Viridibacillus sp. FSL E2-0187]|uniref:Tungsten formylmethanofuran dehydrogenase n=1 Tax=Viridibacillus arvi TaxID=263475 RepID=A0A0M0LDG7_9BACL|nr:MULTISPECIES: SDR family oxidoreductase [Viridibacillus]KOO48986.1 tungsten formylmethanofuran dehydrogenase [Viridibacillus arvi]QOV11134.1 SDR family oxidoreductase [Viridibacillus sp. JNUCC-6]